MLWQFFFSVVSKMVSNIDIFQGIVSKLEIPVSWQHYLHVIGQTTLDVLGNIKILARTF